MLGKIYEFSGKRVTLVAVKPRQWAERHPSVPEQVCKSLLVLQREPALSHKPAKVDLRGPQEPKQY